MTSQNNSSATKTFFLSLGIACGIMALFVIPAIVPHCPDCNLFVNRYPPDLLYGVMISSFLSAASFYLYFFWDDF